MSKNAPGPREMELRRLREQRVMPEPTPKKRRPISPQTIVKEDIMPTKKTDAVAPKEESKKAIVAKLLKRKNGCTGKDVKQATGWPSVSMPALAKSCGLKLTKEKTGSVTRYYGSAA